MIRKLTRVGSRHSHQTPHWPFAHSAPVRSAAVPKITDMWMET